MNEVKAPVDLEVIGFHLSELKTLASAMNHLSYDMTDDAISLVLKGSCLDRYRVFILNIEALELKLNQIIEASEKELEKGSTIPKLEAVQKAVPQNEQ